MAAALVRSMTVTGVADQGVPPSLVLEDAPLPSSPAVSSPQHCTMPPERSAQAAPLPTETAVASVILEAITQIGGVSIIATRTRTRGFPRSYASAGHDRNAADSRDRAHAARPSPSPDPAVRSPLMAAKKTARASASQRSSRASLYRGATATRRTKGESY